MRFNGVDLLSVHPAISISKEIPPGMPARDLRTIQRQRGELLTGFDLIQDEYIVRVNVAGKTRGTAWEARAALAEWATSSGQQTGLLEPTHWPGMAYDAIVKDVHPPEFKFGFGVIEISFALPEPVAHEMTMRSKAGKTTITMEVGGSWACDPIIIYTAINASSGLVIRLDSEKLISLKGDIIANDVIEIDTKEGGVTINGIHAEDRIIYTDTNLLLPFSPGSHRLNANADGTLEARWYNRWA